MATEEITVDPKAEKKEAKAAALAKRDEAIASMAPVGTSTNGEGMGVLANVRLEPKSFAEALVCAEIAFKMRLGKCESRPTRWRAL